MFIQQCLYFFLHFLASEKLTIQKKFKYNNYTRRNGLERDGESARILGMYIAVPTSIFINEAII